MSILKSIVAKEAIHIVRDRRTMVITLVMPLILLALFGFAISMEVNNVRVVAVTDAHTQYTRNLFSRLQSDNDFSFKGTVSEKQARDMLRRGETDAIIYIRQNNGKIIAHIATDASNPATGQAYTAYLSNVAEGNLPDRINTNILYNPQLKSAYNFVPGILGMIFILICAIMTSVSIVSEKESGTMDLLLVSPIKPQTIIFGKLIPYFILSCLILVVMLLMSYTLLGLPLSHTIISVAILSILYIVLSLSIGLLVSTLVANQVSALLISAVLFMLPVIMLSGMIFPIDNMPAFFQWLSCAIPARWYIQAMRKLMIQQLDFTYITTEFLILSGMTILLLSISIRKFKAANRT